MERKEKMKYLASICDLGAKENICYDYFMYKGKVIKHITQRLPSGWILEEPIYTYPKISHFLKEMKYLVRLKETGKLVLFSERHPLIRAEIFYYKMRKKLCK